MTAGAMEVNQVDVDPAIEQLISEDSRVQHELRELNSLLRQITDETVVDQRERSSGAYVINEYSQMTRWALIISGQMNLKRLARFRDRLMDMPYIIEARTIEVTGATVVLRLSTVGEVSKSGLYHAISTLRVRTGLSIDIMIDRLAPETGE